MIELIVKPYWSSISTDSNADFTVKQRLSFRAQKYDKEIEIADINLSNRSSLDNCIIDYFIPYWLENKKNIYEIFEYYLEDKVRLDRSKDQFFKELKDVYPELYVKYEKYIMLK